MMCHVLQDVLAYSPSRSYPTSPRCQLPELCEILDALENKARTGPSDTAWAKGLPRPHPISFWKRSAISN